MSDIAYRMSNRVQERLKDILKRQIMTLVLDPAYFYLDKKDFEDTFQELIKEINSQKKEVIPLCTHATN